MSEIDWTNQICQHMKIVSIITKEIARSIINDIILLGQTSHFTTSWKYSPEAQALIATLIGFESTISGYKRFSAKKCFEPKLQKVAENWIRFSMSQVQLAGIINDIKANTTFNVKMHFSVYIIARGKQFKTLEIFHVIC